jgi:hypothetical protein
MVIIMIINYRYVWQKHSFWAVVVEELQHLELIELVIIKPQLVILIIIAFVIFVIIELIHERSAQAVSA